MRPRANGCSCSRRKTVAAMIELIKHDLGLARHPPRHVRVGSRACRGGRARARDGELRAKGLVYQGELERPKSLDEHDEWEPVELTLFRSTQFGDDQDRPLKKSDGSWTYFGGDAAYHLQKAEKADHLVNIWGADHAGTVKRVQAAVKALTDGRVDLDVKIVQMVKLLRAGEPIKMSQALGQFRDPGRCRARSRQGRRAVHDADQARRHAAGVRLRQGGRGVEGQSGVLRPICPCPDRLAAAQGGGRRACRSTRRPI